MTEVLAAIPEPLLVALAGVYAVLAVATAVVAILARRPGGAPELAARTRTWWWIVVPVSLALIAGPVATAILFALISFVALREFLSIIPVRQVDRAAILIAYLAIPLQYWFVTDDWYGMFTIFIPVYVTAAIALRLVLAGETRGFIRSAGTLQWGLFLTVYNLEPPRLPDGARRGGAAACRRRRAPPLRPRRGRIQRRGAVRLRPPVRPPRHRPRRQPEQDLGRLPRRPRRERRSSARCSRRGSPRSASAKARWSAPASRRSASSATSPSRR